jgi:CheY-like chemotaxis protein
MGIVVRQRNAMAPRTILIVEDDEEIAAILEVLLFEEFGADIILAQSGGEASRVVHTQPIDLILLDYHLPDTDGLQLYDSWQHYYNLADIPVIMTSANPPREELEKRHLMNITKPFNLEDILQAVEHGLMSRQRIARRRVY